MSKISEVGNGSAGIRLPRPGVRPLKRSSMPLGGVVLGLGNTESKGVGRGTPESKLLNTPPTSWIFDKGRESDGIALSRASRIPPSKSSSEFGCAVLERGTGVFTVVGIAIPESKLLIRSSMAPGLETRGSGLITPEGTAVGKIDSTSLKTSPMIPGSEMLGSGPRLLVGVGIGRFESKPLKTS
jgi:hypothetical protein